MMSVVVDQHECPAVGKRDVAVALEAATDALEFGQRLRDRGVGDAGLAADRDRGKRVLHVVHAGQVELDRQSRRRRAGGDEAHASRVVRDVDRAQLRIGGRDRR